MNQPNDGGPAFPDVCQQKVDGPMIHRTGMSLRDYFAAKAMPVIISQIKIAAIEKLSAAHCHKLAAQASYFIADTMLAERAKGQHE